MIFQRNKAARKNFTSRTDSLRERRKVLRLELLEDRRLLAVGPQLIGIDHANGVLIQEGGTFDTAPRELVFRFDEGQLIEASTLGGIRLLRSGGDYLFDNGNDVVIQPGFVGLGQTNSEVVMRFSQTLLDDAYRVEIIGVGTTALRNTLGLAFNDLTDDGVDNGENFRLEFNLALGAQIISVVPQPVVRDPLTNLLSQAKNQIQVYFNQDEMNVDSVTNPAYYRLIDTEQQTLLFPEAVSFDTSLQRATLEFANDLPMGTFHLQIGASEEFNGSIDAATNLGTVAQQNVAARYSSPELLDADGNPVAQTIPDGTGTLISVISVLDPILIADLNVEVELEHTWAPDLRVFLQGPGGQRIELMRDFGTEVFGGQIYGVKFNDLNGNGNQDAGEPSLEGWTIFIDLNGNAKLDAGEPSTATDSQGRYSFVGLELNRTYQLGAVPQPRWQSTLPVGGGLERLFGADFSSGQTQLVRFSGTPDGGPQSGTFRLGFDGRVTELIEFAGQSELGTTAANIEAALAAIVDPGIVVNVSIIAPVPETQSQFLVSFSLNGPGTAVDHPVLGVTFNGLDRGEVTIATTGDLEGFTSFGPSNQWNLTTARGLDSGHTGLDSFYFGAGGGPGGGGSYANNANGTLITPVIDLTDPTLSGGATLRFNHRLRTEAGWDFATVNALVNGQRTELFSTDVSTSGFVPVQLDLSAFVGSQVQIEFNFTSDSSITDEGWFVDDIQVSTIRGLQAVTLTSTPVGSLAKNINFGSTRGPLVGPDEFGYEAFRVNTDFEDISPTGTRVFREFNGEAIVRNFGSVGADQATAVAIDAHGNYFVTGSFQGTVQFGPGPGAATLTSAGASDIFLAKLSADGQVQWARRIGSGQADSANALALDSAGNVHLTGSFTGTVDFDPGAGTANLTSAGSTDVFILKLDTDGNFLWVQQLGGTGTNNGAGLAVDSDGNVISVGSFSGSIDMNPGNGQFNLTSAGGTDIFVSKLSSSGDFVWARRAGSTGNDRATGVAVDSTGATIITGAFSGTVDFDPGAEVANRTAVTGSAAFVWKLSSAGSFVWANAYDSSFNDRGSGVAVDGADNVFFTGSVSNAIQVRRLNPATGEDVWLRNYSSTGTNAGEAIRVSPDSTRVVVTGAFRGTVNFGGGPLESAGGTDIFELGLLADGTFDYARRSGGTLDDVGLAVALDNNGNAITVGAFRGTATFDLNAATQTVTSGGSTDIFVATSVAVQPVDDDSVHLTAADLNGFQFPFYGNTYNELFISTNGLITFGSANSDGSNTSLTDPPVQASIAAFWDDLVVGTSERSAVFWERISNNGQDRLVIQWNTVQLKGIPGAFAGPVNFQAVLNADGTIQLNYQDVLGPLTLPLGDAQPVGTFTKGFQTNSHVAHDAAGNHVVVWESIGQETHGLSDSGVFGRLFNSSGQPLGPEFQINITQDGNQFRPRVSMRGDGRFVVVWQDQALESVMARVFSPTGSPLTDEIPNSSEAGIRTEPDVQMFDSGEFVVVWQGAGESFDDPSGVAAKRYSPLGVPLNTADEVQHIQFLGPPADFSSFTLIHNGVETGPINFAGAGRGALTADNIQTALRALPNTGDTLRVEPLSIGNSDTFVVTFTGVDGARNQPQLQHGNRAGGVTHLRITTQAEGASGEFRVSNFNSFIWLQPRISADATGAFTVAWTSFPQDGSGFGVVGKQYDATGNAVPGDVDEVQGLALVSGSNAGSQFRLRLGPGGPQTGFITYLGVNRASTMAQNIQTALQAIAPGAVVEASPGDSITIQRLTFTPNTTGGTFRLAHEGLETADITFAGADNAAQTATNIQTALNALTNLAATPVVVTALGGINAGFAFNVEFAGSAGVSHPLMFLTNDSLTPPAANLNITMIDEGGLDGDDYRVTFRGAAERTDHPLLEQAASNGGFLGLTVSELQPGSNSQYQVNVETLNSQLRSSAAKRSDGSSVVVWQSAGQDGDGLGIFARVFDSAGAPITEEFGVNTISQGNQQLPQVAASPDGSFAIVWHDFLDVFIRLFGADAVPLGDEIPVAELDSGNQTQPAIASLSDGRYVITWSTQAGSGGIHSRLIDATGGFVTPEQNASVFGLRNQYSPSIAQNSSGQYVVAWTDFGRDEFNSASIFAQTFSASGIPLSPEIHVNEFRPNDQLRPRVAIDDAGSFVVVWDTQVEEMIGDNVELRTDVRARVFDINGTPISSEIGVHEFSNDWQDEPDVAMNPATGEFVVIWQGTAQTPNNVTVSARQFDQLGNAQGAEFRVSSEPVSGKFESLPRISMNSSGRFVATWYDTDLDSGFNTVNYRIFDADGTPLTENLDAREIQTVDFLFNQPYSVALAEDNRFAITWRKNDFNGYVRWFDAMGNPTSAEVQFNDAGEVGGGNFQTDGFPEIRVSPSGEYVIVWGTNSPNFIPPYQILAQRFTAEGLAIGDNTLINQTGETPQSPVVASGVSGEYLVGWLTENDQGFELLTRQMATAASSVGIKAQGAQSPGEDLLQIWVDGSRTQLVGPGVSTRIALRIPVLERLFAVDDAQNRILELNASTGEILNSIPTPVPTGTDAGLAYAGNSLYYLAPGDKTIYILDPATGVIVGEMELPASSTGSGLAYLQGQLVVQGSDSGQLLFVDTLTREVVRQVNSPASISGGLVGTGSRGTLFAVNAQGQLVELSPADGSLLRTLASPGPNLTGLAFVDGVLLVANASGLVRAINPDTGAVLSNYQLPSGIAALGGDGNGGVRQAITGDYDLQSSLVFDDEGTVSITAAQPPFTARYRPVEQLSTFDQTLANGIWRLQIQDVQTGNSGLLHGWSLSINDRQDTPPDARYLGYVGDDVTAGALAVDDVDIYRFDLLQPGTITIQVHPTSGLDAVIRLFNSQGNQLAIRNSGATGQGELLEYTTTAAGRYFVGITSGGNTTYAALTGMGATGGNSTGSYELLIDFSEPLEQSDDNSSFATATTVGFLGQAGQVIRAEIRSNPMSLTMPGGLDEPGHRHIPAESHLLAGGAHQHFTPSRLLMAFQPGVTDVQQQQLLATHGLTLVRSFKFNDALVVETAPGADLARLQQVLSASPLVSYAELDYVVHTSQLIPNDPDFSQLWGMNNVGQIGGTFGADINAPEAWELMTGSEEIVISVIDTGVDYNHPDLIANMWINPGEIPGNGIDDDGNGYIDDVYGIDAANGDSDPWDDGGHGTHVAGTIAAVGNNGIGVTGVAWNAKIMALKFLGTFGGSTAGAIEVIDYMTMMKSTYGINIVTSNNSWGGGPFSQALQDAIQSSIDAGILFVAAAGNAGNDNDRNPSYPASYPLDGIISVAASDPEDKLARVSDFGSTFNSNFGATTVDIAAPGVSILSTTPQNTYSVFHGTSMASPHVAGVAALMAAYNPAASVLDLKQAIMAGSDTVPNLLGTTVTGGRLNAFNALQLISQVTSGPLGRSVATAYYNFGDFYGALPSGDIPSNGITENQKQRAREIFEIYGHFLGIEFIETDYQGLTVVTGDMRAMDPTITVGPGGVAGLSEGSLVGRVIMDAAEDWGDSEYGGSWFQVAMHEIGHSMGLGHTYDLPNLTIMGGFGTGELVFPGDHDLVHGRYLFPNDSTDIDLYQFTLTESGWWTGETNAERLQPNASLLDTTLWLYRETVVQGIPSRQLIARNDDYYGSDSYINLRLQPGSYFVGVTSTGLIDANPAVSNTGFGGTTEGSYELMLNFVPDPAGSIRDTQGTPLDGNADGRSGGLFDFWFQSGPTIFVDKLADVTAGINGNGSLESPFDNIAAALKQAQDSLIMPRAGGSGIQDGESFSLSDGVNTPVRFEFNIQGLVAPGSVGISLSGTETRQQLAEIIATTINATAQDSLIRLNVTASVVDGVVRLSGARQIDKSGSPALLNAPNLIRVVGNGGSDGLINTIADNRPYLVGLDINDNPLSDGVSVEVPQGVTLMIDGGALFKMSSANIDAGSSSLVSDRRQGAVQLLGSPGNIVSFYSYHDDSVGGDSDGPSEGPRSGDWGGLVLRADSDWEQQGVFLNWVNHAELVHGGGKLLVGSVEEQFTPVHLVGARPTVSMTTIRQSADAAMSADPLSFEDSLGRTGPKLHGNLIINNSVNGLFVRITTELGQPTDTFSLPSRWSNSEIVHVVTENLLISAQPGGPKIDPFTGVVRARIDGRLAIDPGVIVKLAGARMETMLGAQLIAEGTRENPIIFTSLADDSYGGSGSFDTTNDRAATTPLPGQWGGLIFNAISKGNLDHTTIMFAGGLTAIDGGFDRFNAVEVHQADVRIANSLLRHNAAGEAESNRNGLGTNAAATIFVRGAQPIIVSNIIRDNAGAVININANSLQAERRPDSGRTTGTLNALVQYADNRGPLVRANRLQNNSLNGMVVRGAVLTTESVWDDTDIVHALFDEITILNHHTFSGLRLQSSENESLVIKLQGANAGFTANGTPLDIDDRIGGSLYVVSSPGRPVIFTSLTDDSATAGFDVVGQPLGDTNNNGPSMGAPGDWRSLRLDRFSNDRNVALVLEQEPGIGGTADINHTPGTAQFLGVLAPNEKSGDINRRLGFEVHGTIGFGRPSDMDVYSFTGIAGTEVWLDIDRSGAALDSVLELVSGAGSVLARSVGGRPEDLSGLALPLIKAAHLGGDFYTINPLDASLRVILPGVAGQSSTYFVRVRSNPAEDQLENLSSGLTSGEYRLQIRLRQVDEKPGSIIRGAEIRYATTGIEIIGLPKHSPLIAESVESTANNETLGSAQSLGNLLTTDRNVLSVGGNLLVANDVDWYSFTLDYDLIQAIGGSSATGLTWSTIFDIDYADGLARPDTVLSVFDSAGNLILVSRDSNIEDDQPVLIGTSTEDLSRGSFGGLDPFIGSVQMPTGSVPLGSTTTYYVAVSSNSQLPLALNASFAANPNNSLIRLEPVNSVQRVAEDHIGFSGYASGNATIGLVPINPTTNLFDISSPATLSANVVPFSLNDVVLYVSAPGQNGLQTVNPFTGQIVTNVGNLPANNTFVGDLVMRSDGRMFMVEGIFGPGNAGANTAGRLVEIDPNTGAQTLIGNDSIPDFNPDTNPPNPNQLTSNNIGAMVFLRTGFDNAPTYDLYYAVDGSQPDLPVGSTLFRANPANGSAAAVDGEPWGVRGGIFQTVAGDVGRTTGMAFVGETLYGVSDTGLFYVIDPGTGRASNVVQVADSFSGLALGPQNVEGGQYAQMLFAISTAGDLRALNTQGVPQAVFADGATTVSLGRSGLAGLAFSPLDFNLWHPTLQRRSDAGHGINAAFDDSRSPGTVNRLINGREVNEQEGGASFYFGFENWVDDAANQDVYFTYDEQNSQHGILRADLHRDLASNLAIGGNYNLPGGALGTLRTNSFDLSGSSFGDKPTLYFNYFLETENRNSATNQQMRDSARVLISTDGGTTWELLATNNSVLSTAATLAELPRFISPSVNASTHPRQQVQELFDNTGGWRQSRVDLSNYAGLGNLLVRFDFSTSGSMNQEMQEDTYGNFLNREKALNNNFEGFYVDDIIIGYAERGEMVTGANSQSQFFTVPANPNSGDLAQVLVGDYQLEIRRGTEYGETISSDGDIAVYQTFPTNERMIPEFRRLGDRNLERDQGQVIVESNSISHVSQAGILVTAGARDVGGSLPHPGSVIRTPTVNTQRLVPGVHIENNLVTNFGQAGIIFSGDAGGAGLPLAAVPFGRILNNTIYGGDTAGGTGILVHSNASPTILNNVVTNSQTGISIDATSLSSVLGANLFKGNTANGTVGEQAILLAANQPLFVNPAAGNFYLAAGSLAIDSSIDSLADRPAFVAVKQPLGIPPTPIFAPDRDRYGQLRLDDPNQDSPPGLGSNIFKDRGAIERADFVGPTARLVNPADNDTLGVDLNPHVNSVLIKQPIVSRIVIQLLDVGIGIDPTTVLPSMVSVSLDGVPLVSGTDYNFTFNPTNNLIILTSLANNGPVSSTYEILLNNSVAAGIKDLATNPLQRNELSGMTRFVVATDVSVVSENAPDFEIPAEVTVLEDNEAVLGIDITSIPDFVTNIVIPDSQGDHVIAFTILAVSNPGLFEQLPAIDPAGTLTFKTALDRNGSSLVIVQLVDLGLGGTATPRFSVPKTFTIQLTPINDPPEFTMPQLAHSLEDQGVVTIAGFANPVRPGPSTAVDELNQEVTFVLEAANPSLFNLQPTINSTGDLRFQTVTNLNSDITDFVVTVYLMDNGSDILPNLNRSLEQTFTIVVAPVNDPPVFTIANRQVTIDEDHGQFELPDFATNIASGPSSATDELASQSVHFEILSVSAPDFFSQQPAISVTGALSFVTAEHRNGTALVVARLVDDGPSVSPNVNVSTLQTFTITINPINDPPEFAVPGSITVDEDQGLVTRSGFATGVRPGPVDAVDESSQLVQFGVEAVDPSVFVVQPSISPNGTLVFRVADNVNSESALLDGKSLQVRVRLMDNGPSAPPNQNTSAWRTFVVNVTPVNDPPISPDFETETNEDTPITLLASQILAAANGGPSSDEVIQRVWISQVGSSTARGGTIVPVFNSAGTEIISLTYSPPRDAVGIDSFVFVMRDDGVPSRQGTASVIIDLLPVNDAPQFERGVNPVVLEDAGPITIANWATNILPGPISAIDELAGQNVSFTVIAVDPAMFTSTGQPAISAAGILTFQTAPDATGPMIIRIRAVDNGSGASPNINSSAEVLATITVQPVNDPPVFTSGGNVVVLEDSGAYSQAWATSIAPAAGLLANPVRATDESGQVVSFVVNSSRTDLFSVQPVISSSGVLSFTPAANAHGAAVLVIQAVDNGPSTAPNVNASSLITVTLTITPDNDVPVAVNDSFETNENVILTVPALGLLANDTDFDLPDDELSVVAGNIQSTFGASVVLNANGSFSYDPRNVLAIQRMTTGQSVIDTFVYQIRDLLGATSNQATVSITVTGVDDPPVAVNDSFSVGVGQTAGLVVLANDSDVDSLINPASVQITRLPIFGSATVLSTGVVQYTAGAGFVGTDTFGYTVRDMAGNLSNEALVTVSINNPPVANDDIASTFKNESVLITVLSNDTDTEGVLDPSSVQVVNPPSFGLAEVQPNGQIRFTPNAGFAGVVTFTYTVADTLGLESSEATVTVRVRNSRWQNPAVSLDVSTDGRISSLDALLIINYLNSGQPRFLPDSSFVPPPYIDVNGDERVSALDALLVINHLNLRSSGGGGGVPGGGEGEGESQALDSSTGVELAMMVTPQQMIDTVGRQVSGQVRQQLIEHLQQATRASSLPLVGPLLPSDNSLDVTLEYKPDHSEQLADDELLSLLSTRSKELRLKQELVDRCFLDD